MILTTLNRLLESHRRLVDDCNNNGIACTQTDAQLEGAKELNVLLRESLDNYRAEVAECVTKLDMCYGDWRIFTCDHNTIHDIPDGVCITHGVYTDRLAKDLCVKFSEDPAFVRVYNAYRKSVLKHHRAHERVDQGRRAMRSWRLKTEFLEVDGERGIVPNY